jgi:hypothetical protein
MAGKATVHSPNAHGRCAVSRCATKRRISPGFQPKGSGYHRACDASLRGRRSFSSLAAHIILDGRCDESLSSESCSSLQNRKKKNQHPMVLISTPLASQRPCGEKGFLHHRSITPGSSELSSGSDLFVALLLLQSVLQHRPIRLCSR